MCIPKDLGEGNKVEESISSTRYPKAKMGKLMYLVLHDNMNIVWFSEGYWIGKNQWDTIIPKLYRKGTEGWIGLVWLCVTKRECPARNQNELLTTHTHTHPNNFAQGTSCCLFDQNSNRDLEMGKSRGERRKSNNGWLHLPLRLIG